MTSTKPSLVTRAPSGLSVLRDATEARIALGRTGAGLPTRVAQTFLLDHARAREAVWSPLDTESLRAALVAQGLRVLDAKSAAGDRAEYLRRPDMGRRLADEACAALSVFRGQAEIAIVVADGLSATAVEVNAAPVIAALTPLLEKAGLAAPVVVIATQARVALGDGVGDALSAKATVVLVGERPGLSAADSLGAYLTWGPVPGLPDSRRNCISNIRDGGLVPSAAAAQIAALLVRMFERQTSGIVLDAPDDAAAGLTER